MLFAAFGIEDLIPLMVFAAIVAAIWGFMSMISNRNSQAIDRLSRLSRPPSLSDLDDPHKGDNSKLQGLTNAVKSISKPLMPQTAGEQSALKNKLANAGFRSEAAPMVYSGIRLVTLAVSFLIAIAILVPGRPLSYRMGLGVVIITCIGFYIPSMVLWYLRTKRQEEIFLSLPDALDLLVVCVESGLGLDAGMRKVTEEMGTHAKTICEEFSLANFQLQMGRPRREVLHDLGVRTGVDDVKSLAAILIQADRFGSSIAQALRVQSDAMRTRRKQIAEEKAAKTAVKLIFPLVLFIFPGIFVVLVGPAAINIMDNLLNKPQ
jgi:tight adherence protein C